ncbi:MAG: glycosyltransferase family 2 protein [Candidatus Aminicenantes bacterium]|nr:glycosyltransferase family 2 protein [Candidatus Aminicenantes bacterium]
MKLSIVIPVYNEYQTLERLLDAVAASPVKEKEIILVDDFSSDGTRELLSGLAGKYAKLVLHEKNQGKGAAIRSGLKECSGDVVIIQDADLEYDPNDYGRLLEPIEKGRADVVYGSRFLNKDGFSHAPHLLNRLANRVLTVISNIFSGFKLTDMETCYKMMRRDVVAKIPLEENRFGFEPEITAKLAKLKIRLLEIPISYRGRTHDEGKKIGWSDGFRTLYAIMKYNLFR